MRRRIVGQRDQRMLRLRHPLPPQESGRLLAVTVVGQRRYHNQVTAAAAGRSSSVPANGGAGLGGRPGHLHRDVERRPWQLVGGRGAGGKGGGFGVVGDDVALTTVGAATTTASGVGYHHGDHTLCCRMWAWGRQRCGWVRRGGRGRRTPPSQAREDDRGRQSPATSAVWLWRHSGRVPWPPPPRRQAATIAGLERAGRGGGGVVVGGGRLGVAVALLMAFAMGSATESAGRSCK